MVEARISRKELKYRIHLNMAFSAPTHHPELSLDYGLQYKIIVVW